MDEERLQNWQTVPKFLPMAEWTDVTVRGRIPGHMIGPIVFTMMRGATASAPYTMSDAVGQFQFLMCTRNGRGVIIDCPKKRVREIYKALDVSVPVPMNSRSSKRTGRCRGFDV